MVGRSWISCRSWMSGGSWMDGEQELDGLRVRARRRAGAVWRAGARRVAEVAISIECGGLHRNKFFSSFDFGRV